jgi:signal transduction histidine kinase
MPAGSVAWLFVFHQLVGSAVQPAEYAWSIAAIAYSAASACFMVYLRRHPDRGVHIQYAFLVMDPLIVGAALLAAPEALAWWLVLLLVMIARVGFRYGLNAMKFELGVAWIAAAMPLLLSAYWHAQIQMAASLVLMLLCTWWLFAPLNRSLERAKALDIENAKIQSLQESLKAKSEFLSRVSHELRSPLQSVVSALEVIEGRFGRDPTEAELLSRIRRGTNALHSQLRDLLTLARGDVGKMEIHPMPFEVGELVTSVAREVEREAAAKGLSLVVRRPEEPTFVVADGARIDQVLTNLLTNATRHTERGSVMLEMLPYDPVERSLRFRVSDTGPGIDEARLPTLFEPYTRFGELTRHGDGAGLGLAVVRSVLRFLGGEVTVISKPGDGTAFDVAIPAEPMDPEASAAERIHRHRVLVVDDREDVLEAISSVVRQLGFDCDTTASAASAANLLGARTYDIAFIDNEMPIKSGSDLASDTRRGKGPNARTRMISISAAELPEGGVGWPFDGHMAKPVTKADIQRAIQQPAPGASEKR